MFRVILKKGRARPFFGRHPWVFSGSIQTISGNPENGAEVPVYSHDNQFIAWGLFNSKSQIRVRLYSWEEKTPVDEAFLSAKLKASIRLRRDILKLDNPNGAVRLVNSEADGLAGLTVDRYGEYLALQWGSLALRQRQEAIFAALKDLCRPKGIYVRLDKGIQELEGMEGLSGLAWGEPAPAAVRLQENELFFEVDLNSGQKTGAFLDQRENRFAVRKYAQGRRCLDLFCYTGGFVLNLAVGGASEVLAVDSSRNALASARRNAELNGMETMQFEEADSFEVLKKSVEAGKHYGLIVLDPPKFAKAGKDKPGALQGYAKLNALAISALEPNGILITCSCSGLVSRGEFMGALAAASEKTGRAFQVLEQRGAAADHPVSPACPETEYLKCFICRVP